jgi:hypothetical protein
VKRLTAMRAAILTVHSLTTTTLRELLPSRSLPRAAPRRAYAPRPNLVPVLLALTLVTVRPGMVAAHPGDLDPSFGTGGAVTTSFGGDEDGNGHRGAHLDDQHHNDDQYDHDHKHYTALHRHALQIRLCDGDRRMR